MMAPDRRALPLSCANIRSVAKDRDASTKWVVKGEDICITMTVIGVKCRRFAKISGGLDTYTDGIVELRLRR
jgi:hypothetical protein